MSTTKPDPKYFGASRMLLTEWATAGDEAASAELTRRAAKGKHAGKPARKAKGVKAPAADEQPPVMASAPPVTKAKPAAKRAPKATVQQVQA